MILLTALLISLTQLLLCGVCGLGLAMLLPHPLRSQQLILAPGIGFAVLAVIGFYGTVSGLTLRQVLPLALALALAAFVAGVRASGSWRPGAPPPREAAALTAIMLLTWGLAVAPAIVKGRLMPFGYGMDVEFYMGLAAYLVDYSYVTLPHAPAGPIRDLLTNDHIGVIAFGGSYVQGMANVLGGWEAWVSWVPMQATLRVVAGLSLYALARGALAIPAPGALAGTLLAGLHSLLLWLSFNNFSASLAGLCVLLSAVAVTLPALERGGRGPLLVGALLIGGLACTYWPMLTAYGALGFGLGLAALWSTPQRIAVILRGVGLLAAGGMVGLLPNLRAPQAFPGLFAASTAFLDIDYFVPPAVIAGTLRFAHLGSVPVGTLEQALGFLGLAAALALLAFGLWRGADRRRPAALLGACIILYLLGLRVVVGYPYGYFRGASYVSPVLFALIGAGFWAAARGPASADGASPRRLRLWGTGRLAVAALLGAILIAATGRAAVSTVRVYAAIASGYPVSTNNLDSLVRTLGRPGPVLFSSAAATALCGNRQGAWAYWLRDRPLLGHVSATFSASMNPRGSTPPAYGVLLNGEDPTAHGLTAAPLWQDSLVSVYPGRAETLAWMSGLDRYTVPPRCSGDVTNTFRAGLGLGDYAAAQPGRPLTLSATQDTLRLGSITADTPLATRSLQLALASFITQTVTLDLGDTTRRLEITPGLTFYDTGPLDTPLNLVVRSEAGPLLLRSAELTARNAPPNLSPAADTLLLGAQVHGDGDMMRLDLRVRNQSDQALRLALEIYEEVYGYASSPARYAGGIFALPPDGDHRLDLDLLASTATLGGQPLALEVATPADGRYFAALWVYQGDQVRRQIPLASFERRNGQIVNLQARGANAVFVPIGVPAQPLAVRAGDQIALHGYELGAQPVRSGDTLRVSLLWETTALIAQPYLVFVQLLDAADAKVAQWDGAAGGDWRPTLTWIPGQRLWQDVPLSIAADTPPGRYRVVAGLYDPVTGARLPLSTGGDMLTLTEIEVVPRP